MLGRWGEILLLSNYLHKKPPIYLVSKTNYQYLKGGVGVPLFLVQVTWRFQMCIYPKITISQMSWWMHPWRTSSVCPMEKMTILGLSHPSHSLQSWANPSLWWSPTCTHPVILWYRRLRMQVRVGFYLSLMLSLSSQRQYFFYSLLLFWLTGVIQELQFKLREHCHQVTAPQNFRPAPGTVCCAQFSGKVKLSGHQYKVISLISFLFSVWPTFLFL